MTKINAASAARLNASTRKAFLVHLAETANVSASARAVNIGTSSIYAERRRLPAFRAEWTAALAEGYARLEADLLSDALTSASAKTTDAMLKSRAQKDRLRLALLAMHRTSVKTAAAITPAPQVQAKTVSKAHFLSKLFNMRTADDHQAQGSDSKTPSGPEAGVNTGPDKGHG
jgi:hypothetical protein